MNNVVQLLLAASVDGFGDGAMQNVDGVVARVVHVGLGPQTLKQVLDEVRAGRCQLRETGLSIIQFKLKVFINLGSN
jgi:hypothetical protein